MIARLLLVVALWALGNTLIGLLVALAGGARPVRWQGAWVWRVKVGSLLDRLYSAWAFPIAAQTFGLLVLLAPGADRPGILEHELVHVRQQLRWGLFFFPVYLFWFLVQFVRLGNATAAYRAIPFEVEAYAVQEHR